ncbi:DUF6240 domain-containing protein [Anaerosporobacter faecicola]|uniref:DUF6240 domain-containing protein n=1 Tax=Anaerosporobacter faecicola TaxID=2718714 RepID=UPI00143A973B|nr:DUF6240 domain-containing protein [Anaerosporobacter faecicola]
MNIQNVNSQVTSTNIQNNNQNNDSLLSLGNVGDEIEGIVTEVSDSVAINFGGKELSLPKGSVQSATKGETKRFEIMELSPSRVVLRELGVNKVITQNIQAFCTKVETDQAAFNKHLQDGVNGEANGSLRDSTDRMTGEDGEDLEADGYNYKKYELERLERALTRIKEQRANLQESVENQVQNNRESKEDIQRMALHILKSSPYANEILDKLEAGNLPITESNITKLVNGMNLAGAITEMSQESYAYLIQNDMDLTVGNVYKASYSAFQKNSTAISEEEFQQLKGQVEQVITNVGYEANEENLASAKWMLEQELPLTEESFKKLKELENLKDSYQVSRVLDQMIRTMEQGNSAEDTLLVDQKEDVKKVLADLNKISDEAIIETVKKQEIKDITIAMLKNEQEQLNQFSAEASNVQIQPATNAVITEMLGANAAEFDIKAVQAKRQLEEIRLKMTVEAGQKMAEKGIDINTTSLEKIVQELRNLEDEYYKNLLKESGTAQTAENVTTLRDTTQKINELKWMPNTLLADTFTKRAESTLQSLHDAGSVAKSKYEAANESYETLMTAPRQDMGDSIQKAFRNSMSDILSSLALEDTQANQRAVRMLAYNGMDITSENIASMKEYDEKVNTLLTNLTPSVTMDFIKENKNPLNISLDDLNVQVQQLKEEKGITQEDGYAKYLYKLEKQEGITEQEREAYIGIYRLLNNVNRTDGAAIGALVKSGRDITLGNLLTEARTKRGKGVDQTIDNSFGMLSELNYTSKTITQQINTGFTESPTDEDAKIKESGQATTSYNQMLLQEILSTITPSQLNQVMEKEEWSDLSLEKLKEMLDEQPEDETVKQAYYSNQVKELRKLAEESETAIQFLSDQNIPITIQSIQEAQVLLNKENTIYKQVLNYAKQQSEQEDVDTDQTDRIAQMDSVMNAIVESLDNREELQKELSEFAEVAEHVLEKEVENPQIDAQEVNALQILRGAIRLSSRMNHNEYYDIPVKVGDQITNISLTVVRGSGKQDSKMSMSVQSEKYGTIEAQFQINQRQAKGMILCQNQEASEMVKESMQAISKNLEQQNIKLSQMDIGIENIGRQSYTAKGKINNQQVEQQDTDSKVTTKELYQVAKSFVVMIKQMEQVE